MTRSSPPPEPLESRVTNLESGLSDLRIAAEALLQTAQIHQRNFETVSAELQASRQRQLESDQRFEILLAELRQLRMDSETRFNNLQGELRQLRMDSDTRFNNLQTEIIQILERLPDRS